jgi:hypothetical protein
MMAGGYVSILFDRNKAGFPMMAIPLRMDEEVYCSEPVLTCVFNRKTQTLIVDDLISMNGAVLHHQNTIES